MPNVNNQTTQELFETDDGGDRYVSFIGPWNPVYIFFCAIASLLPFFMGYALGLTVASDVVFGVYVIFGGLMGDLLFKKIFHRTMIPFPAVKIRFLYLWPFIGILVMLLRPFE